MRTIILTLITAFLAGGLMLSGCSGDSEKPVTIGTNYWTGYEPLHYASSNHFFPDTIATKIYDSTNNVLNDYRSGKIQAAALTLDEVMILKDQGYNPMIIAVLDISSGGDVIVADPSIPSVSMLRNKNIAVESGALGSYIITRALEIHGLKRDDVMILPINADNSAEAYKEKIVDAVVTYEPLRSDLIALGAKEIFSSKDIPNEIVDVLVINRKYATPATISALLSGWEKGGNALIRREPDAIKSMSRHMKLSPEDFLASLEGLNIPSRALSDELLHNGTIAQTILNIQNLMLEYQLIQRRFDSREILPDQYYRQRS